VKEVINDLIMKLTQEARVMKTNSETLNVSWPNWSEIVAGSKNRSGDLKYSSTHSISTTDTMQISKVQAIPKIRNNFKWSHQTLTMNPPTLKTAICQA
jgi:hypothetical protein